MNTGNTRVPSKNGLLTTIAWASMGQSNMLWKAASSSLEPLCNGCATK